MTDEELVKFLKWSLPQLHLRWPGFRKVRRTVRKRLIRRMRSLGMANLSAYRATLQSDPSEWDALDSICRIPISRFCRDKGVYDRLARDILPECASHTIALGDDRIRVLSAGCASGEEPYSISLIWHMCVATDFPACSIDILALDVDEGMLQRASAARYAPGALKELSPDMRSNGFVRENGFCRVREEYRRCVRFIRHDLRKSVPDGPYDLILCRNTAFTYFDGGSQLQVRSRLFTALRTGGHLVLGMHEDLPDGDTGFARIWPGQPLFRKLHKATGRQPRS